MASLNLAAPTSSLASSTSSLSGLKLSPHSARPTISFKGAVVPVRSSAQKSEAEKEREIMKRRAIVFGVFASAIAAASNFPNGAVLAEEDSVKKRNKCPTICVQNRTASCCFG